MAKIWIESFITFRVCLNKEFVKTSARMATCRQDIIEFTASFPESVYQRQRDAEPSAIGCTGVPDSLDVRVARAVASDLDGDGNIDEVVIETASEVDVDPRAD